MSGMALGGVLISAIGAASSTFAEGKKPTVKSVSRDFIIGAVMVALIIQLLPESSTTMIQFLLGLVPLSLFQAKAAAVADTAASSSFGGVAAIANAVTQLAGEEDVEVKVGVPRF
jgi:hypothetical protein